MKNLIVENKLGLSAKRAGMLVALAVAMCAPMLAQDTSSPPPPPQQGQGPGGPGGRGGERQQEQLDRMTKALKLSPDQVTQIKAIQADGMQQMMAMRNDAPGPDRRAKMMAMRDAEQTKVKAVLTDDQKVKYDAMMEKMKEHREHQKDGNAPPPPPPPAQ